MRREATIIVDYSERLYGTCQAELPLQLEVDNPQSCSERQSKAKSKCWQESLDRRDIRTEAVPFLHLHHQVFRLDSLVPCNPGLHPKRSQTNQPKCQTFTNMIQNPAIQSIPKIRSRAQSSRLKEKNGPSCPLGHYSPFAGSFARSSVVHQMIPSESESESSQGRRMRAKRSTTHHITSQHIANQHQITHSHNSAILNSFPPANRTLVTPAGRSSMSVHASTT
jgi:hypothetical protein